MFWLDLSWSMTSRFQLSENSNRSRSRRLVLLDGGLTELSDLASVKQTKTIEKSLIGVLAAVGQGSKVCTIISYLYMGFPTESSESTQEKKLFTCKKTV